MQHRANYLKFGPNTLNMITGQVDSKETLIEAAYREAAEETSIDKHIDFETFKQNLILLNKNHFSLFLFRTDKVKSLKNWTPIPKEEFKKEVNTKVFENGNVWLQLSVIQLAIERKLSINDIALLPDFINSFTNNFHLLFRA